jgi:hypothetical protein
MMAMTIFMWFLSPFLSPWAGTPESKFKLRAKATRALAKLGFRGGIIPSSGRCHGGTHA